MNKHDEEEEGRWEGGWVGGGCGASLFFKVGLHTVRGLLSDK